jgi:GntR family transcriptional regulator
MNIDFGADTPIFTQLASELEDAILSGAFPEEGRLPSVAELAASLRINPATALRGLNELCDSGAAYKKRGMGMFVSPGAASALREKRRQAFRGGAVAAVIREAKRLALTKNEVMDLIEGSWEDA